MLKFIETESRTVVPKGWGEEKMRNCLLFNGRRVSVFQEGKRSGDWLPNNVNIFNTTELYTQKWLRCSILCYVLFFYFYLMKTAIYFFK